MGNGMTSRKYYSVDFEEDIYRVLYRGGIVDAKSNFGYRGEGWLVAIDARNTDIEEPDSREMRIVFNAGWGDRSAFDKIRREIRRCKPKFQADLEMSDVILPAMERMMRHQISETTLKEYEDFEVDITEDITGEAK